MFFVTFFFLVNFYVILPRKIAWECVVMILCCAFYSFIFVELSVQLMFAWSVENMAGWETVTVLFMSVIKTVVYFSFFSFCE